MSSDDQPQSARSLFETGKRFYLATSGRQRDPAMALDYLERSAGLGYSPAQRLLGVVYLEGEMTPRNLPLALKWLTAAAGQGDQLARFNLAQMYALGRGVAKDWGRAHALLNGPGMGAVPEALELKRRLKEELARPYPNLSAALESDERGYRAGLSHRQKRYIPNFLDPGRGDDGAEFETWLGLNLGRLTAAQARDKLRLDLAEYYRRMVELHPAAARGAPAPAPTT
ncbi:MAG: sel1 repeat family protein [Deltaproteobacteria bacterium]|jgi:hypothetical protein|nr:sel1 repeat family protein [Deltaproteobacteria bacterium]